MGQKAALLGAELFVRPQRALGGHAVGALVGSCGGLHGKGVVVAANHRVTGSDQVHGLLHHVGRVGAIAHQVAQQGKVIGAMRAGVLQAGVQRLAVGVDV